MTTISLIPSRRLAPPYARLAAGALLLACAGCVYSPPYAYYPPYPAQPVYAPAPDGASPAAASAPANCHEFQQSVTIDGKQTNAYGTTCQQADGTWRISQPHS